MGEPELVSRTFRIVGRVQGVYFRVWTRETALNLGLVGTVRNLPDGSVEARVMGRPEVVKVMEERLWEGPSAARVEAVEGVDAGGELPRDGFLILR